MQKQQKINTTQHFFQRQGFLSLQCGTCSVNHLLGQEAYNSSSMNQICYTLSDDFINPHKSIWGGDFDVNVLIIALQRKGYQTKWHDSRKPLSSDQLKVQNSDVQHFLINIAHTRRCYHKMLGLSARHWVAAKKIQEKFYLFDSGKTQIEVIGNLQQFLAYMNQIRQQMSQIIYVFKSKLQ